MRKVNKCFNSHFFMYKRCRITCGFLMARGGGGDASRSPLAAAAAASISAANVGDSSDRADASCGSDEDDEKTDEQKLPNYANLNVLGQHLKMTTEPWTPGYE